jgi:hypothetical protein
MEAYLKNRPRFLRNSRRTKRLATPAKLGHDSLAKTRVVRRFTLASTISFGYLPLKSSSRTVGVDSLSAGREGGTSL